MWWNKKSKDNNDKVTDIVQKVKTLLEEDKNISCVFLIKGKKGGACSIQGDELSLIKMIMHITNENNVFKNIIKNVYNNITVDENDDKFHKDMKLTSFDMPNGRKGIALDPDNVTDSDIDDIINDMLKGMNNASED